MKTVFKSDSKVHALRRPSLVGLTALAVACLVDAGRADSLWPAGNSAAKSMVADRKATSVGDILTIVVAESAVAQSSQKKSSARDSSLEDSVSRFVFPGYGMHKGAMPGTLASGKTGYSGGGDVSNSQSISARAAVLVTDVLPNGNLVIEGVRVVTFSGETQYVVLRGIVRGDDIAPDNSVVSTNIAEARVQFYAEGAITDAQKRGWLATVYEKLRPI